MGTNAEKRQRQQQNREASPSPGSGGNRTAVTIAVVSVVLLAGLAIWQFGSTGSDEASEPSETTGSVPADADPTPCPPTDGSAERVQMFTGPPEFCIDPATTDYTATVATTAGSFTAQLDPEAAPETVNNFVVLSRYRYYNGVPFHRIIPGFVIQGGDGDGEPYGNNDLGYTIDDELPGSADVYTDYSLAMANAGPDTNGSQFFVVLPGGGTQLTPAYSYFGEVTEGRDVVDTIGALGGDDGVPTDEVLIETVEITESPR